MDEQSFLTQIESFLHSSGMTPTAFGVAAVNDPSFVFDLREGRSCSLKLAGRIQTYMNTHKTPPGVKTNGKHRSTKGS